MGFLSKVTVRQLEIASVAFALLACAFVVLAGWLSAFLVAACVLAIVGFAALKAQDGFGGESLSPALMLAAALAVLAIVGGIVVLVLGRPLLLVFLGG